MLEKGDIFLDHAKVGLVSSPELEQMLLPKDQETLSKLHGLLHFIPVSTTKYTFNHGEILATQVAPTLSYPQNSLKNFLGLNHP
ncbi:MAG: hypothetical protein JWM04_2111 [Verrucomicrobiales bacterium]|nr:hypothetical protein [Verrucomicrobiales bacterium]